MGGGQHPLARRAAQCEVVDFVAAAAEGIDVVNDLLSGSFQPIVLLVVDASQFGVAATRVSGFGDVMGSAHPLKSWVLSVSSIR